jgi:hypothetical protein
MAIMRMSATHSTTTAWCRVMYFAAAWLVLLAGCDAARVPTSPEARAREFLDAAIRDPQNIERLTQLAGDPAYATSTGLDSAPVRVGLDYLRARLAQGASLELNAGRAQTLENGAQRIPVAVQPSSEPRVSTDFELELEPVGEGWRLRRVTTPG